MIQAGTVSTSIIAIKHIFGINSDWKNHVHYINDHKIIYPAGHNIVVYNTDDKTQSHISGIEGFKGISAITLAPSRKFLGFAEKGERPAIYIFERIRQTKRKNYMFQDVNFKDITALAFAPNNEQKFLVCLSGLPDVHLYYIQWDKSKAVDSIKVVSGIEMTEVAVNPSDHNFITCLGPKVFRCYRLQDNKLRLIHSQIPGIASEISQNYTTHCWLPDGNVIVCTANGDLILLNTNCEFQCVLPESPGQNWHIESIIPYAKGFIIGGDNLTIHFYEADFQGDSIYRRTQTLNIKNTDMKDVRITSLSVVPGLESKLVCCTQTNNIYTINIKNENQLSIDEGLFEPVTEPYHFGAINAMDVCIRKPLIATCGTDRSIRIWNFEDMKLECCKYYPEEAISISIHPSGFHLVVGFSDKVKLMNIGINNQLHETNRNFPYIKNCRVLKFSNGGQYFAAANGSQSNHMIQVFTTYTGEARTEFRGHSNKIKSLVWSKDDTCLVSCGIDGFVYAWKLSESSNNNRLQEVHTKGVLMNSVAVSIDNKTVYAVGTDKYLKEITDNAVNRQYDAQAILGALAFTNSNKLLFAGIADDRLSGAIRCYKYPIIGNFSEYQAHDGSGVEALRVTYDDQYLISAGKDGTIIIFEVKDKEARGMKIREGFSKYADEIFVTKRDMEELKNTKETLKGNKKELQSQTQQFSLSAKDEQIKQLKEKQRTFLEAEQAKYSNLENTIKELQQEHIKLLEAQKKKYDEELAEIESTYQRKTREEVSAFEEYKKKQEEKREEYREKISEMINKHNEEVRKLEERFTRLIDEEVSQKERSMQELDQLKKEHEEIIRQIKDETNKEVDNLQEKFDHENRTLTDNALKIKGDVSIANKKLTHLEMEEAELKDKQGEYEDNVTRLTTEKSKLKEEIEAQKKVMNDRDKIIGEKERKIYELKKRTQELEKFKFVLDFKIKELKRDTGPRDEEIANMKKETNEMDMNLKKLSSINNTLGLVVDELDRKQADMQNHIKKQRIMISEQTSKIKAFKDDVYKAVQYIQNYDALKEKVIEMKDEYARGHVKNVEIDPDIYAEYVSQRKYLEKSVGMLKKNLQKDSEIHKQDNLRIMRENVELIKEINKLRREIREIKYGTKNADGKAPANKIKDLKGGKDQDGEETDMAIIEKKKIVESQREKIKELRNKLESLIQENEQIRPKH